MKINLSIFSNILALLKTLHWGTYSYSKHMALDQAFDDLTDVIDKFVEVAIGIYGRHNLTTSPIIVNIIPDETMYSYISEEFVKFNNELINIVGEFGELESIFDEIKSCEQQLMYRLKLK